MRDTVLNELVPKEFYLVQNYPNPFRDKTTIKYCVAYKTNVKLTVYDSEGEVVKELVNKTQEAGTYEVEFSIQKLRKMPLENGIYSYRLVAGNYLSEKEMTLQK